MRQDNHRGKPLAAANHHLRRELHLTCPRVTLELPQRHVAGRRAAWGARMACDVGGVAPVASGGAPNGPPRHYSGDPDGHLMPLSPAVRVRYDSTVQPLYAQSFAIFTLTYVATCG